MPKHRDPPIIPQMPDSENVPLARSLPVRRPKADTIVASLLPLLSPLKRDGAVVTATMVRPAEVDDGIVWNGLRGCS